MTWIHAAWVVVGLVLGVVHAAGIWRSAKHPTATTAVMGLVRLLVVGLALAAAAIFGGILPAAAGWAVGFFASVGIVDGDSVPNQSAEGSLVNIRVFGDPKLFEIGPFPVTETMLASLGVSIVLVLVAALFRFAVIHRPDSTTRRTRQTHRQLARYTRSSEIIGRPEPAVATLTGSLFIFIAACNISGQFPGVHPATASLATTSALAIVVFLAVPLAGIRARGLWGYVKHYFSPNPILFPLHLVSEVSRTVALAMRLFGNIMSGHLVVGLLVALSGFLVPMPFMALDLLIGLLQAYIFAVLSTVFIGAAIGAGEEA